MVVLAEKMNIRNFRAALKSLKNLTNEGTIKIDANGMSFSIFDDSHALFLAYRNRRIKTEGDAINITVDTNELYKVLQRVKDDATIEYGGNEIKIKSETPNQKKTFIVPLITPSQTKEMREPKLSFAAEINMAVDDFNSIVTDAKLVAEEMQIRVENGEATFHSKDYDGGAYQNQFLITGSGNAVASYKISYLEKVADGLLEFRQGSELLKLQLSNNAPLRVYLAISSGASGVEEEIEFLLAPIITRTT